MLKKSGGLSARLLKRKKTAKRIYPMGPSPVISFTNYNYRYVTMFTVNPPDILVSKTLPLLPTRKPEIFAIILQIGSNCNNISRNLLPKP